MRKMIPYGRQSISKIDIAEILRVLKSSWLTQGPKVREFEIALAKQTGARYAVAVSNGTAALHLACLAFGVEGKEVITSPITFLATANSVLLSGGKIVFADVDEETVNLDPEKVRLAISSRTAGIIPVHLAGRPCDMRALQQIAKKKNLFVLEDACHALGAKYKAGGRWHRVGSCAHSDACVFSFHPVKTITTGEGGAITTNNKAFYEKLLLFRNHGMTKDPSLFKNKEMVPEGCSMKSGDTLWYYEMHGLGLNYRLTDIQAALGLSQLQRLSAMIRRRREIVAFYHRSFAGCAGLGVPSEREGFYSAWHLYVIRLQQRKLNKSRAEIFRELRQQGIGVQIHYIPVHLQPYYRERGFKPGDFPVAEQYYEEAISIPLFPSMRPSEVKKVIRTVKNVFKKASKSH